VRVCQAVAWLLSTIAGGSDSYLLASSGACGTKRSTDAGTGSGWSSVSSSGSYDSSSSAGGSSVCFSSSGGSSSSSVEPKNWKPMTTAPTSTAISNSPASQRPRVERWDSSVYWMA